MRLRLIALAVLFALATVTAWAQSYYLVGDSPLGCGWRTDMGLKLSPQGDGSYSVRFELHGCAWFVLADGLTSGPSNWDAFNAALRIGPCNGNELVQSDTRVQACKAGTDNGAFSFTGDGFYTLVYEPGDSSFIIYSDVTTGELYIVAGTPAQVFGTEWDNNNYGNAMLQSIDGTYYLHKPHLELAAGDCVQFKVLYYGDWGQCWPAENMVVTIDQTGTYDLTIIFDPSTIMISYHLEREGSQPLPGDMDGDGTVDINDVGTLIDHLLLGGANPAADFNNDGEINIVDLSNLIDYLLTGIMPQSPP